MRSLFASVLSVKMLFASLFFCGVALANQAPQLAPIPEQTVVVEQAFVYRLFPSDPDNTVPGLRMQNAPANARLIDNKDGSRSFHWTPTAQTARETVVLFTAIDALDPTLVASQRMVLIRRDQQSEPLVASVSNAAPTLPDFPTQQLAVGERMQLFIRPRDEDGTVPGLTAKSLPQGASLNDVFDGSRLFEWTPNREQVGTLNIVFIAIDAANPALRTEQSVTFVVKDENSSDHSSEHTAPSNNEPTQQTNDGASNDAGSNSNNTAGNSSTATPSIEIDPVATQIVNVGQSVKFRVAPRLSDGAAAVLHVDRLPANASFDDNRDGTRTFRWSTDNAGQGEHRFRFTALHPSRPELRASIEVSVYIGDPNAEGSAPEALILPEVLPLFVPVPDQRVVVNQDLRFRVEASTTSGRVPALTMLNGPSNARFEDNFDGSREFYWTPNSEQVGESSVRFVATDSQDERLSSSIVVGISVLGEQSETVESPPPDTTARRPENRAAASRFLYRATFGPNTPTIDRLMSKSYSDWILEQQNIPPSRYLDWLDAQLREYGLFNILDGRMQFERQQLRSDVFWNLAVNAPDQLRQRVALALSQILVVSDTDSGIDNRVRGIANYHDLLAKHAFGNYRDLLYDVTLNPMMGDFLSMRRNEKPDPDNNIQSDENYAREFMQLFTIGTTRLQMNGLPVLDSNGQTIATYSPDDVTHLAHVFTGWNYGDAKTMRSSARTINSDVIPMKAFEEFHDKSEKTLIGGVKLSGSQSAQEELSAAIDVIYAHPNVAPNIASRLIKSLVTSNPSPEYVERVATVFENNGEGVRGDLKSVVTAVLLDTEALDGHEQNAWVFGKIKEPILKITALWRAFNAKGEFNRFRYSDINADFLQRPYSAPSVFNFFSPDYKPPGQVAREGLLAPEAQILHDTTVLRGADRLFDYAHAVPLGQTAQSNQHAILLNIEAEKKLAHDVPQLVSALNEKLLAGSMSDALRNTLIELGNTTPNTNNGEQRVREILFVLLLSPEYAVQR